MLNISDRTYDILRWAVSVVLPAVAALYAALAALFGWPFAEEISATVVAVVLFLGTFLQAAAAAWAARRPAMLDENQDGIPDYPFKMSGPVYDTIKWISRVALPAISVAYVALAQIWGWPYVEMVSAVTAAVVLFMGTILQFSSAQFQAVKARGAPIVE